MSFESGKTLGGLGALFMVIGSFVPFLSLVGVILLLLGLQRLADHYNDNDIFQNALFGLVFGVIGIIAGAFVILAVVFGVAIGTPTPDITDPVAFIAGLIVALAIVFIFYLLAAIFYKKSFDRLAAKTGEKMFGTAGLLLLIGAVLTIILIGLLLMFVAWILLTVAFFSMKTSTTEPSPPEPPPPPPLS
ncbi:MAG: DUF996 domain-containing protein [Candidatus Bathyarchaeota archaeon]|nr:MAG: DUF996 domain-containing protein [Candidatus Bathyarchaeota archaeon]